MESNIEKCKVMHLKNKSNFMYKSSSELIITTQDTVESRVHGKITSLLSNGLKKRPMLDIFRKGIGNETEHIGIPLNKCSGTS